MFKIAASIAVASALFATSAVAQEPAAKVTYTIDKWHKPGSNNPGLIDVTVNNANDFPITAIRLRCDYAMKAGGKKIEAEQTLPLKLKANTKKTFKKNKFPYIDTNAADGTCKLVSASK